MVPYGLCGGVLYLQHHLPRAPGRHL
jgi:hypothetical protein